MLRTFRTRGLPVPIAPLSSIMNDGEASEEHIHSTPMKPPLSSEPPQYVLNPFDRSVLVDHKGNNLTVDRLLATRPLKGELLTRPGPGNRKLTYLSGESVTRTLNEVFGYDGWSLEIIRVDRQMSEQDNQKRWCVMYLAQVRITVRRSGSLGDNTNTNRVQAFREDMGCGESTDRNLATATSHAMKASITDAMKRAARHFGDKLGNSLYQGNFNISKAPRTLREALDHYDRQFADSKFGKHAVPPHPTKNRQNNASNKQSTYNRGNDSSNNSSGSSNNNKYPQQKHHSKTKVATADMTAKTTGNPMHPPPCFPPAHNSSSSHNYALLGDANNSNHQQMQQHVTPLTTSATSKALPPAKNNDNNNNNNSQTRSSHLVSLSATSGTSNGTNMAGPKTFSSDNIKPSHSPKEPTRIRPSEHSARISLDGVQQQPVAMAATTVTVNGCQRRSPLSDTTAVVNHAHLIANSNTSTSNTKMKTAGAQMTTLVACPAPPTAAQGLQSLFPEDANQGHWNKNNNNNKRPPTRTGRVHGGRRVPVPSTATATVSVTSSSTWESHRNNTNKRTSASMDGAPPPQKKQNVNPYLHQQQQPTT